MIIILCIYLINFFCSQVCFCNFVVCILTFVNAAVLIFPFSCVQVVAHNRDEFVRRKFRVMNLLASMFDTSDWLIVHSPFIYTAGVTKSVTLCDVS